MIKSSCYLISLMFILQLVLPAGSRAQVIVDNPEKPKNRTDERVIKLEEVMRIWDDGKNYVLRNPQQISELEDGSIFFFDFPHVIRVDNQGKFLFKIPGQGQ